MKPISIINTLRSTSSLHFLLGALLLLLPFSIAVDFSGHQVEFPNEPLLLITSGLGALYVYHSRAWTHSFFKQPLFWASLIYLLWAGICTLVSNHFYVSAKYTLVSYIHWWVYFCLAGILFSKIKMQDFKGWALYSFSFVLILIYAWVQHSKYDFRLDASVLVARPFYFDHALYSCVALLLLGYTLPFWRHKKAPMLWFFRIVSVFLLIGVYLSFSRAAWMSLIAAGTISTIVIFFKLNFKQFLIFTFLAISIVTLVIMLLISNKDNQVLSKQGNSWQHLQSTLNVSTDVSNLERLNRYSCAWRMFKEKPVFGFGPGNFIIDYYPFQKTTEMTRLSVKSHQRHRAGKGGGSHSEYLQALAETGVLGFVSFLGLILVMVWTTINISHAAIDPVIRWTAFGLFFGLLTFFIHSLFNNFLHQEKAVALVWMSMAMIANLGRKQF